MAPATNKRKVKTNFSSDSETPITLKNKPRAKIKKRDIKVKKNEFDRKNLFQSPSVKFDKLVPKVEDILREQAEREKFKKMMEKAEAETKELFRDLKRKRKTEHKPKKRIKIVDCKHLSLSDLSRKFKKDVKFLDDIFYGITYSERHERFKINPTDNQNPGNDLRCNEAARVFTEDQRIHIVSLFRHRYGNGDLYKWSDYYYKVLLPEYCVKIFMDCYKKTYAETMEYLKSIPVTVNIN